MNAFDDWHGFYKRSKVPMYHVSDIQAIKYFIDSKLADVIAKATKHTKNIAIREHIKATRHERVGHFVVCLRRELTKDNPQQINKERRKLLSILENRKIWYDAGVLDLSEVYATFEQEVAEMLEKVVDKAASLNEGDDNLSAEMDELREEIKTNQKFLQRAIEINSKSDNLIGRFVELVEFIEGTDNA